MDIRREIIRFLATGTYTGYLPLAPGTMGTLWGIPIFMAVKDLPLLTWAVVLAISVCISIYLASRAQGIMGGKDPSGIVCDEISGFMVATFLVPFSLFNVIMTFLIFRFFDILKPYPVSLVDRYVGGGTGIVLDDVVAGIYTNMVVHGIIIFLK